MDIWVLIVMMCSVGSVFLSTEAKFFSEKMSHLSHLNVTRHKSGQVDKVLEGVGIINYVEDPQIQEVGYGVRPRIPSCKLKDYYT